jgi:hypothetical protein
MVFLFLKALDKALEVMKNISRRTDHGNPPRPKISPPVAAAAQAPLLESEPTRQARTATMIARITPMRICGTVVTPRV